MAGNLFDVFVVGSADPTPAGENKLASALSAKHGVPLQTISKAIAAKNLRAGQSLDQAQAQTLVRQMQAMGAVTIIRPAAGPPRAASQPPGAAPAVPRPTVPRPAVPRPAAAAPPPRPGQAPPPVPGRGDQWSAFGPPAPQPASPRMAPPLGGAETMLAASPGPDPFAGRSASGVKPNPFSHRPASGARPDPFAPPPSSGRRVDPFAPPAGTPPVPQQKPPPERPAAPDVVSSEFMPPDLAAGPRLELARPGARPGASPEDTPPPVRVPSGPGNLRDIGASAASGVAMDEDPRNLDLVRCAQHGLYYDKTKASACRKCLSSAREMAAGFENRNTNVRLGNFGDQPAKRAFAGLGLAMLLGLLPAAYYSFGPGTSKARQLRIEQEVLSRQPGTEEILRRFDEIDDQINQSREISLRNTAVVWAAVSVAAMAGWYKIT